MTATVVMLTATAHTAAAEQPGLAPHAVAGSIAALLIFTGTGATVVVAARTGRDAVVADLVLFATVIAALVYCAATERAELAVAVAVPYLAVDVITYLRPRRLLRHARQQMLADLQACADCDCRVGPGVPDRLIRRMQTLDRHGWRMELVAGLICPACACARHGHQTVPAPLASWIGPVPPRCRRCGTHLATANGTDSTDRTAGTDTTDGGAA
ncbi:MAG: hypothetical protein GEV09_23300 [Pseudonocardiaceae bacterium]|nr:hypothetical protein [Pseudonocardiaceae bacterium]